MQINHESNFITVWKLHKQLCIWRLKKSPQKQKMIILADVHVCCKLRMALSEFFVVR